jgi:hypothetical protein
LDNFIIGKRERRGKERREELAKNSCCFQNIEERKRWQKSRCCFPNIEDRIGGQEKHIYICSLFLYIQAVAAAIYHKMSSNSSSNGRGLRNISIIISS